MSSIREAWLAIRETVFTVAQVVTLGVVALVLGLIALSMVVSRSAAATAPAVKRPLVELVPTIVAATPTALAQMESVREPTPSPANALYQPPGLAPREIPTPRPPEPIATATPRPAVPTARPPATATRAAVTSPTATTNPTSQMMKVLPTDDGLPARVRSEPTTRSPILVRVPLGAEVEVLGAAQGDELESGNRQWFKIRFRGVTGYVYSPLLGR